MPLVLCRVDDRLVHGQVVIGWGRPLAANRVVLVDDDVAASPWEQDLYRMAAPDGLSMVFATVAQAITQLSNWHQEDDRTILLTGDLGTMTRLHAAHPAVVAKINLGGIHHREGRRELLRYLYLDGDEVDLIRHLTADGAEVSAQDLPTAKAVGAEALL